MKRRNLPIKHELYVLLLFRQNPELSINMIYKKSGMYRKTFFETKERLRKKGFLIYTTNGNGKAATNITVTEPGFIFLNEMRALEKENEGWFSDADVSELKKIINQDIAHKGRIFLWRCPYHPKIETSYHFVKKHGVFAYCTCCRRSNHWNIL